MKSLLTRDTTDNKSVSTLNLGVESREFVIIHIGMPKKTKFVQKSI